MRRGQSWLKGLRRNTKLHRKCDVVSLHTSPVVLGLVLVDVFCFLLHKSLHLQAGMTFITRMKINIKRGLYLILSCVSSHSVSLRLPGPERILWTSELHRIPSGSVDGLIRAAMLTGICGRYRGPLTQHSFLLLAPPTASIVFGWQSAQLRVLKYISRVRMGLLPP